MGLLDQATMIAGSSPEQVAALAQAIGSTPRAVALGLERADPGQVEWSSSGAAPEYWGDLLASNQRVQNQFGQLTGGSAALFDYAKALDGNRRSAGEGILHMQFGKDVVTRFAPYASSSPQAFANVRQGVRHYYAGRAKAVGSVVAVDDAAVRLWRTLTSLRPSRIIVDDRADGAPQHLKLVGSQPGARAGLVTRVRTRSGVEGVTVTSAVNPDGTISALVPEGARYNGRVATNENVAPGTRLVQVGGATAGVTAPTPPMSPLRVDAAALGRWRALVGSPPWTSPITVDDRADGGDQHIKLVGSQPGAQPGLVTRVHAPSGTERIIVTPAVNSDGTISALVPEGAAYDGGTVAYDDVAPGTRLVQRTVAPVGATQSNGGGPPSMHPPVVAGAVASPRPLSSLPPSGTRLITHFSAGPGSTPGAVQVTTNPDGSSTVQVHSIRVHHPDGSQAWLTPVPPSASGASWNLDPSASTNYSATVQGNPGDPAGWPVRKRTLNSGTARPR